jgi:hypothetical protein
MKDKEYNRVVSFLLRNRKLKDDPPSEVNLADTRVLKNLLDYGEVEPNSKTKDKMVNDFRKYELKYSGRNFFL